MPRDDYYDRDQEEWRRRREREQQFGGRGEFYGQGGYEGYGLGGYGQEFGRPGWYGMGGYGMGGYGQGGYGVSEQGRGSYGGSYGPGGYEQSQWRGYEQGPYGQGTYGQRSFGQSQYGQGSFGQGMGYGSSTMAGRFYGRGPKGYRRSDERIRDEVSDELYRHPDIDASEVEIQVQNGEVTLTGKVEDRHQKRLAEDIAERAVGVTDVHNQLKVDKGFFAELFGTGEERERERTTTTRRGTTGTTSNR